ncbi:MAG: S-layer homology domain-containing protein, partial [Oscillospiraceae bacterium]|nr:S-layer homology domain-containing protein [Oscillospiraceae bacterium]
MRIIKRKRFSHRLGVFALAVLLALSATLALQADADIPTETGDFTVASTDGDLQIGTDYTYADADNVLTIKSAKAMTIGMKAGITDGTTTNDRIAINSEAPANITIENVKIDVSGSENACAFDVGTSALNLTLSGENILKSNGIYAGLQVEDGASITITSIGGDGAETGTLKAYGGQGSATPKDENDHSGARGAGIGAPMAKSAGAITINGGTIEAYGGYDSDGSGAGIGGGGAAQDSTETGGNGGVITINGGKVSAYNSPNTDFDQENGGAAIGGGGGHNQSDDYTGGHGGTITITGGKVTAYANEYSAAIGSANRAGENNQQITINGGEIEAASARGGAGIGGGGYTNGGTIIITGGNITAKSNQLGAGIGGGYSGNGGVITIAGGVITAAGSNAAAGIGGGSIGNGGVITITGGLIYATSTVYSSSNLAYGAGIGGAYKGAAGTINISGGVIIASGGNPATVPSYDNTKTYGMGADIGSGYEIIGSDDIDGGSVTITGGTILAVGGGGNGLGSTTSFQTEVTVSENAVVFTPRISGYTQDEGTTSSIVIGDDFTIDVNAKTITLHRDVIIPAAARFVIAPYWEPPGGAEFVIPPGWTLCKNGHNFTKAARLAVDPENKEFGPLTVGYAEASAAAAFTIKNDGIEQVTALVTALGKGENSAFTISSGLSENSLDANATATISVQPKPGLEADTYADVLTVSGTGSGDDDLYVAVPLSVTVTAAPSIDPPPVGPPPVIPPPGGTVRTYALTVVNGSGSGRYGAGEKVTVAAYDTPKADDGEDVFAGFTDLSPLDWFYEDVKYVAVNGLIKGVDAAHFSPLTGMTRGMLITTLGRLTEGDFD